MLLQQFSENQMMQQQNMQQQQQQNAAMIKLIEKLFWTSDIMLTLKNTEQLNMKDTDEVLKYTFS